MFALFDSSDEFTYEFDFNNDGLTDVNDTTSSDICQVQHKYIEEGLKTARVIVTDSNNEVGADISEVTVGAELEVTLKAIPWIIRSGKSVGLIANVINGQGTNDATSNDQSQDDVVFTSYSSSDRYKYKFLFGDGDQTTQEGGNSKTVTHIYTTTLCSLFNVIVEVTDKETGDKGWATCKVIVLNLGGITRAAKAPRY